jgi:hypothetical protein
MHPKNAQPAPSACRPPKIGDNRSKNPLKISQYEIIYLYTIFFLTDLRSPYLMLPTMLNPAIRPVPLNPKKGT